MLSSFGVKTLNVLICWKPTVQFTSSSLTIFALRWKNLQIKSSFVIASAGRHSGLTTPHIKDHLLHQGGLGQDVRLQITHIVLFRSPPDRMQVTKLNVQSVLGSQLKNSIREAMSALYGQFLIHLSPRTDGRLQTTVPFPKTLDFRAIAGFIDFGLCRHKTSLHSKCSNQIPGSGKIFSLSLAQKGSCIFSAKA